VATTASSVTAAGELDELYRLHAAEVFRYAYAVLGNRADAEDITQTTFVNALRALERGDRPRKPTSWLITIAHNLIRQRFRQQQSRPLEVELDRDVAAAETADEGPSIDELVRALQRIPPTQRQALVLRELEGRSYGEIGELLGVSQSALEALLFRARRSLADELENLVTCDRAELALTRTADGRIGRKERRRLLAHIDECTSCARVAARSIKYRRTFKALAILPLPFSLTLFKGAPSAYAAAGLSTIGAGTAAGTVTGVGGGAVSAKIAVGLAAVAVAGGAGYEGVNAVREPAKPPAPVAKVIPAAAVPTRTKPVVVAAVTPHVQVTKPKQVTAKKAVADKPARAAKARKTERGRSAVAPGRTKAAVAATPKTSKPEKSPKPVPVAAAPKEKAKAKPVQPEKPAKAKAVHLPKPQLERGKSESAPGRLKEPGPAKGKPEPKQ
jgi:RNA polymerase sigma factor (sigma-70 family)